MSLGAEARAAELHLLYQVGNAPVRTYPYPHLLVQNVFPPDFYRQILAHLPSGEHLRPIHELRGVPDVYKDRWILPILPDAVGKLASPFREFWLAMGEALFRGPFGHLLISRFEPFLRSRFEKEPDVQFRDEALLVYDHTNYSLGPHTDSPRKIMSVLFYLPEDDSRPDLGTSVYVPKDENFRCEGGPHYPFEGFRRMTTMPYVPNTMFAFLKTPVSFHGVEPVTEANFHRTLLLYDLHIVKQPPAAPAPAPVAPKAAFTF